MTIAIAVQVHDGIVLASDSASTLTLPGKNPPEVVNVYNNANKIFNLRKGLPIGGMTYGMGSMGTSSISTLAKDLRIRFSGEDQGHVDWKIDAANFTVEAVAIRARQFLFDECYLPLNVAAVPGVNFGFMIGGYSANAKTSELWGFTIENGTCAPPSCLIAKDTCNAYAGGDPEAFSRIVLGHSQKLGAALLKMGIKQPDLAAAISTIETEVAEGLVEAPMPIQDAADLAEFLVHSTCMYTRFKRGAATVGGPVEVAAITKHEGFKWIKRKHYFDMSLNRLERDHEAEHG